MMENKGFSNSADKLVLIVDDDEDIRLLLEILVKKEGFKTETAGDGEEALYKIRHTPPDIILLDLMLPKLGGLEIVRELQTEETTKIPVIIITGRYMDRSTSDTIRQESNVRDFIEKPIKPQIIAALLHKLLKTQPPRKSV